MTPLFFESVRAYSETRKAKFGRISFGPKFGYKKISTIGYTVASPFVVEFCYFQQSQSILVCACRVRDQQTYNGDQKTKGRAKDLRRLSSQYTVLSIPLLHLMTPNVNIIHVVPQNFQTNKQRRHHGLLVVNLGKNIHLQEHYVSIFFFFTMFSWITLHD